MHSLATKFNAARLARRRRYAEQVLALRQERLRRASRMYLSPTISYPGR